MIIIVITCGDERLTSSSRRSPLTFNDSLTNAELALEGSDDTEMTNELFDDVMLAPSQKLQGYVTFDVDSAATPVAIRFTPGYTGSTGVWELPRLPNSSLRGSTRATLRQPAVLGDGKHSRAAATKSSFYILLHSGSRDGGVHAPIAGGRLRSCRRPRSRKARFASLIGR